MRALMGMLIGLCVVGTAYAGEPKSAKDLGVAPPYVRLLVKFCLKDAPDACERREIVNSNTSTDPLYMSSCQGYEGQVSLLHYLEEHRNQLKGYVFGGIVCEFGTREPPMHDKKI